MMKNRIVLILVAFSSFFLFSQQAYAFTITSELTGDPRAENPDGIVVDVSIDVNEGGTLASWSVDIDLTNHPLAKFGEFYFNLNLDAADLGDVQFSNFTPTDWIVFYTATTVGGGNITFQYEDSGSPSAGVTSLAFDMAYNGTITPELFTGAPYSSQNELGSGQLGAHIQGLGVDGQFSGFALGNYSFTPDTPPGTPVPEPGTMMLLGIGLIGMAGVGRKKFKK